MNYLKKFNRIKSYLEVHGFHFVFDSMGLSHQGQYWRHFLWVMEVLHHSIDGVHYPAGMVPKLATSLHLLGILHVLELTEVLFGWREVHKEPEEEKTQQIRSFGIASTIGQSFLLSSVICPYLMDELMMNVPKWLWSIDSLQYNYKQYCCEIHVNVWFVFPKFGDVFINTTVYIKINANSMHHAYFYIKSRYLKVLCSC